MTGVEKLFVGSLFVILAGLVGLLVWVIYGAIVADKFELRKDSWTCTSAHSQTSMVMVGKVLVPQFSTVCDQWTAK